jgi:hypothetical protein
MESIFSKKGPFYFPFTKPILGTIDQLCTTPTNFGCTLNNNYSTTNCGIGSKPVLDCGIDTSAVCCPDNFFPYSKTTKYCTYLNNQGCFSHQMYQWPHGQGSEIPCPSDTYNISDCGLCCSKDITSNINFTDTPFDSISNNYVGTLWNKGNAILQNGTYKITIGGSCVMNFVGNSMPVLYTSIVPGPGDCGGTWNLIKMTEQYIGNGIYPSSDLKYVPGGYTLYNNVSKKYLSLKNSDFGNDVTISLTDKPTVVAIFQNNDQSYRIENARNQIGSFTSVGNIGNPINCTVVNQDGTFNTNNWGNGLFGLPCGIGQGPDQNNYKFNFELITNVEQNNIPAVLDDGEYLIEIEDHSLFLNQDPTNKCIKFDGSVANFGGSVGICGTLIPRFQLDIPYRWILKNESGGTFSLQNKTDGKYIQMPVYNQPITTSSTKVILNIYTNLDNTLRITNNSDICLVVANNILTGYNWNVNTQECGTGPNSTIFNYKLNFVPALDPVIPSISDLPNGDGIYIINTNTSDGMLFDQTTGGGTKQIQPGCVIACPVITNSIPNILEMSGKYTPIHNTQTNWKITKTKDDQGNDGYTIQNIVSNNFLILSNNFNQILSTTPTKSILYLYINSDGSYTIQNKEGACLFKTSQKYANTYDGSGLWNYNYQSIRWTTSENSCGTESPPDEVKFTLTSINQ